MNLNNSRENQLHNFNNYMKFKITQKNINSYSPDNNKKRYLVIIACHCDSEKKLNTIKNNLRYFSFNSVDTIVINSSDLLYNSRVSEICGRYNKVKYYETQNSKLLDYGKWVHTLQNLIDYNLYDYTILTNDSYVIHSSINHFFNLLTKSFINRFRLPASNYAKAHANSLIIAQVPRFALEGIAFGGILILILLLISKGNSLSSVSPTIALFTISGYRLMPAIQQVYTTISQIKYTRNAIDQLYDEFTILKNYSTNVMPNNRLNFSKSINLKSIEYSYPNSKKEILHNLNLYIPINSKIGIVGSTGSGKTTTVDIILGLLDPTSGQFEIDDIKITIDNKRSWQENISYVPQNIYLSDDTIASNIAFGIEIKNINQNAVEKASRIANLHNFVINELPYGYQTQIGERGIRLSGGQRQRIGIARALYNNPKLLILDEATSSLDNLTENAVMDAINNLGNDITIIIIAHRLSTVKNCDKIFLLDKGAIISSGTYDTLSEKSESFIKLLNSK
jgi:ABC-type multidrug transport system fused ATPase/permease subunit